MNTSKGSIDEEVLSFDMGDGRVTHIVLKQSGSIQINEVVEIDYNNLFGEYLTAPTLFNQIANLKTKAERSLRVLKIENEVICDSIKKRIQDSQPKGSKRLIKDELERMMREDPDYYKSQIEILNQEYNVGMMENLYWSMKEKCSKLDNLFNKILPGEFNKSIVEGQVNNVMLRLKDSLIK
jgi:hypothetical protein